MARKPAAIPVSGPKVSYPGQVDRSLDADGAERKDADGNPVYLHPPWRDGDYVHLKPRKNGFVNQQAQFQAQVIPSWATPEVIKAMSEEEFSKVSWRSDLFAATVILEMLDELDPWRLHDAASGEAIEPARDLKSILEVFEEWEVSWLQGEITKLAMGFTEQPPVKDPFSGETFQPAGPTGVSGAAEVPGPGDQPGA